MTQPEALGYAVSLEARGFVAEAAELRRLHEEIQALRKAAEMALGALDSFHSDENGTYDTWTAYEALRQALSNEFNPDWNQVEALQESLREHMAEIQRLRQALEQPKQRGHCTCGMAEQARMEEREACLKKIAIELNKWKQGIVTQKMIQDRVQKEIDELRQALEQPPQEPVAQCSYPKCQATNGCVGACSKTAPPKREWVGLTGDDKHFLLANAWNKEQAFDSFMDAIDKFLKEKNT